MDVPFEADQHDQILSTIPVQFSPHQMEPKSVTLLTLMCLNYCHHVSFMGQYMKISQTNNVCKDGTTVK